MKHFKKHLLILAVPFLTNCASLNERDYSGTPDQKDIGRCEMEANKYRLSAGWFNSYIRYNKQYDACMKSQGYARKD